MKGTTMSRFVNLSVPQYETLLSAFGGRNRLTIMLGASMFFRDPDCAAFKISPNNSKRCNMIEVRLTNEDMYNVRFIKVRRGCLEPLTISQHDIFASQVNELIYNVLGLHMSLS